MDVDSKGFAYLGQNTVRKYDTPKTAKSCPRSRTRSKLERQQVRKAADAPAERAGPGRSGSRSRISATASGREDAAPHGAATPLTPPAQEAARMAFRKKSPPRTPMIVGGLEEIRVDGTR